VLYTEKLFEETENAIIDWFSEGEADLVLVIGTAVAVHPAAGYLERAIEGGAKVAVIDTRQPDRMANNSRFGDDHWYFQGDAAQVLPYIFCGVVGNNEEVS
jgi:NAD-dependent SIR2 family protein deacetylase